ncbi:hypothetical protein ASD65_12920 [Microbacterium sp. Root61]|uniref:hypothetical protein n=1 Tax=Microbacterium sp. Root61 TaxID=1736570 RepID=UPI0007014ABB|nr:hypothetical protein [Microbacterium sp. Root61]KRA25224.1 hypothetical protein ASD65_12920 [Microbacterium sp. Root61]
MSLLMSCDPTAIACLDTLARVRRQVDDAAVRLQAAHAHALALADATRWQTEAARRFRDVTAQWCQDVAALAAEAAEVGDDVSRLHHRVALLMGDAAG